MIYTIHSFNVTFIKPPKSSQHKTSRGSHFTDMLPVFLLCLSISLCFGVFSPKPRASIRSSSSSSNVRSSLFFTAGAGDAVKTHINRKRRHQAASGFIFCYSESDLRGVTVFSPVSVFWAAAGEEEDGGSVFLVVFCLCSRSSSKSSNESSTLSVNHKEQPSCLTSGFPDVFFTKFLLKAELSHCVLIPSSGGGGGSRPPPSSSEPHAAWKWSKWKKSFLKTPHEAL